VKGNRVLESCKNKMSNEPYNSGVHFWRSVNINESLQSLFMNGI
jgi:hypothetical protein